MLKRGLKWTLAALLSLALVGAVYQAIASSIDRRRYPPPGKMVMVAGRRLHLVVAGESAGPPTVILEAGMASFSTNWYWVQTDLARTNRVVAYDRAGLGWSDPSPEPFDAEQSANDLHAALDAAGIAGPFVVAGHSYGGLVVRAFRDRFPDEVVGLVLVDGSHPDQWTRLPNSRGGRLVATANEVTAGLAWLGVVRAFHLGTSISDGLPERQAAEMTAVLARPGSWLTSGRVLSLWDERTRPAINHARSLGNLPLGVLGVTDQPRFGEQLTALQAKLPALSTNSFRQVVAGATHESLVARRENALIVAAAIRRVLESARTGRPLGSSPAPDSRH